MIDILAVVSYVRPMSRHVKVKVKLDRISNYARRKQKKKESACERGERVVTFETDDFIIRHCSSLAWFLW